MSGIIALLLAACGGPERPLPASGGAAALPGAAEQLVGTWTLAPAETEAFAAWRAPAPDAADHVGAWLAAYPAHPQARRVAQAIAAHDDLRLEITATTWTLTLATGIVTHAWSIAREDEGGTLLVIETRDEHGRLGEPLQARRTGADRLDLRPLRDEVAPLRLVRR